MGGSVPEKRRPSHSVIDIILILVLVMNCMLFYLFKVLMILFVLFIILLAYFSPQWHIFYNGGQWNLTCN